MAEDHIVNQIFFDKYKTTKKLGQGSFGQVYKGINMKTEEPLALKLEVRDDNTNLLETEAYRLIYLKGEGVPKVYCYGNNKTFNILVIELLGKSLEELFNVCGRKFSLKTVCIIGIEMLKRIKFVHDKNHIHRDIKPDNFMMGINGTENSLYIIDFGLAKKFRSSTKKSHIPFRSNKNITGTARYCSIYTHKGYEQSRRDDLESIGYVLMYFLKGVLPWQGIKCRQDEDHYQKIYEKKKSTTIEELCRGFPVQLVQYFDYVKKLEFKEDPDYDFLTNLFVDMINTHCLDQSYDFDWNNKLKSSTIQELSSGAWAQKANTSLALGNNNISRASPNAGNDSHIKQINDEFNNQVSMFRRDEDNREFEPSIFSKKDQEKEGYNTNDRNNKNNGLDINGKHDRNERSKSPQKRVSKTDMILVNAIGNNITNANNTNQNNHVNNLNSNTNFKQASAANQEKRNKETLVNYVTIKTEKNDQNVKNTQMNKLNDPKLKEIIIKTENPVKKKESISCKCLIF